MKSFAFHRPVSIADAVSLLRGNDSAKLLAGGQSLIPLMKLGLVEPTDVVSLAFVEGAGAGGAGGAGSGGGGGAARGTQGTQGRVAAEGTGTLAVSALATHDEVSRSPEVRRLIPGLAALAEGIGDAQVRNRGTIGGSLAHADPAADYPAAVLALGATIETDRRRIAADDFFTGLFATALAPDEIITAVRFPVPECAAYVKFPHRASRFAVVGVMVAKGVPAAAGASGDGGGVGGGRGVRVAVTGAGPRAFRLPALEAALAERFGPEAASAVTAESLAGAGLRSDPEASAEYRAHLVGVMARRAIQACT